jgi:hypothetical protein
MASKRNVLLGCTALILILCVIIGCGIGGLFILGLNGAYDEALREGAEFGHKTDQQGCLDEALLRLKRATKANNIIERRNTGPFLDGCFQTSRPSPDFCPKQTKDHAYSTVLEWTRQQCQKKGFAGDDACQTLFINVWQKCSEKAKSP